MISSVELKTNIMNKTELIDKLLHLGSTIEICNSTQTSKKAKELAHNLLDEYLKAINYTRCCETFNAILDFSEELPMCTEDYHRSELWEKYKALNCG